MLDRLADSLTVQSEALLLRAERQRLLASNIANADTPGYVARDMDFAGALKEATERAGRGSAGAGGAASLTLATGRVPVLATTAAAHFPTVIGDAAERKLLYSQPAQSNLDGNTVDMDRERANFVDNAVKYEATLRFLNGSVGTMLTAIKGQ